MPLGLTYECHLANLGGIAYCNWAAGMETGATQGATRMTAEQDQAKCTGEPRTIGNQHGNPMIRSGFPSACLHLTVVHFPSSHCSTLSVRTVIKPLSQKMLFLLHFPMLFEGFQLTVPNRSQPFLAIPPKTKNACQRCCEPSFYQGFSMVCPGKSWESHSALIGPAANRTLPGKGG